MLTYIIKVALYLFPSGLSINVMQINNKLSKHAVDLNANVSVQWKLALVQSKFLVNKNPLNIRDIFKCIYTSTCSLLCNLFAEAEMMPFCMTVSFRNNRPDVHSLCQHQSDASGFKLALADARRWVAKMLWLRANLSESRWIKHMDICMPPNTSQVQNHLSWATTNRSDTHARQKQTQTHTHTQTHTCNLRFQKLVS